jgi:hypothetical protein
MAEITRQQVEDAFMQAHNAGDTANAQILADELRRMDAMAGSESPLQTEPQRMRAVAQGATFGGADEIEARARAMAGEDYNTALADIRSKLSAYKEDQPIASSAYEMGGALIPNIAYSLATRQAAPPATATPFAAPAASLFSKFAPNIAKVMGVGAAEGAATTALTSDKSLQDQMNPQDLANIGLGAAIGGGVGGLGYSAGLGLAKGVQALGDFTNVISGSRARNAVTNEVQRIAKEAGISDTDAIGRLLRGEILAEDPTVAGMMRAYRSGGGTPAKSIYAGMSGRPAETQAAAMDVIEGGIAKGLPKNLVSYARMADANLAKMERKEYEAAFANAGEATQPVIDEMYSAMRRYPSGANKLSAAFTSETGRTPFFEIDPNLNKIKFNSIPTAKDAEILRRIMSDEGDALLEKGGAGATIGINLKDAGNSLRSAIDKSFPDIATARENADSRRLINTSFKDGQQAMSKSADQVEVDFNKIVNTDPAAAESYRLGYLANMKNRMSTGAGKSMMGRLNDETTKEGMTLRMLFPQDRLDEALEKIGVAAQSRSSTSRILGGSETAATMMQAGRVGTIPPSISTGRLATDALRGNVDAAVNVLSRIVKQFQPSLSEKQTERVVGILMSKDPQVVQKALTDTSFLRSLNDKIVQVGGPLAFKVGATGAVPATTQEKR